MGRSGFVSLVGGSGPQIISKSVDLQSVSSRRSSSLRCLFSSGVFVSVECGVVVAYFGSSEIWVVESAL